ncbi:hypothetical protein AVDCRST_MAG92-581 [uncultured Coleofasciculus sp.]|uniref:Uncharacterized protein n=1 Tax=uncultured Coleofasciculus sp. TaxID=1267456 RepID=A0A6J4HD48_9CYAN|nr:hypothetical protein AVDCRST_MAG92-581 [uncultured Coleofasciculus sp.]
MVFLKKNPRLQSGAVSNYQHNYKGFPDTGTAYLVGRFDVICYLTIPDNR